MKNIPNSLLTHADLHGTTRRDAALEKMMAELISALSENQPAAADKLFKDIQAHNAKHLH